METFLIYSQIVTVYKSYIRSIFNINDTTNPSDAGPALPLGHAFHEVDYLPENDRLRYTIHPDARKELLKRLLQLNHKLYAEEETKGLHKKKPNKRNAGTSDEPMLKL